MTFMSELYFKSIITLYLYKILTVCFDGVLITMAFLSKKEGIQAIYAPFQTHRDSLRFVNFVSIYFKVIVYNAFNFIR